TRSHRDVRTDQREKTKLELRRDKPNWRPYLVDQRCTEIPGALSDLEISLWHARNPRTNLRRGFSQLRNSRIEIHELISDVMIQRRKIIRPKPPRLRPPPPALPNPRSQRQKASPRRERRKTSPAPTPRKRTQQGKRKTPPESHLSSKEDPPECAPYKCVPDR